MDNVKLSVTIELPGSTMMTSQECDKNPNNYEDNKLILSVKCFDKKTKKTFYKKEPLVFKTRKCISAKQVINMNDDAYNYMTSTACPEWYQFGISKWKKLSATERLELHLSRTCESFGGTSYTYLVLGD